MGIEVRGVADKLLPLLARPARSGRWNEAHSGVENIRGVSGEISQTLIGGRHVSGEVDRGVVPHLFEINKKKGLFLTNRPTKRKSILIAQVIRLGNACSVIEKVVRVERGALPIPPAAAVKLVSALL